MARKLLIGAAIAVALVVLLVGVLVRRLADPEAIRAAVQQQASAAIGQPVRVGAIDWKLSARPVVVLSGVEIGSPAAITLGRVELSTGLKALFSKRVEGAGIIVSGSRVVLPLPFALATGAATPSAPDPAGAGAAFVIASIDRIAFSDVELVVGQAALKLALESSLAGDRLVVSKVSLASAQSSLEGRGEFSSLAARQGTFTLEATKLDLDELLAIASGFSAAEPSGEPPADSPAPSGAASAAPLDVRVELKAAAGRGLGIDFTGLSAAMVVSRAVVGLETLEAGLFGGQLTGSLRLDTAADPPRLSAEFDTSSLDVAQLAAFAGSDGVATGRLGGRLSLSAEAGTPDLVFRTARGQASVTVTDGTLPYLDLVGPVVTAFGKPDAAKARSNAFSRLGGTFALANGVLRSDSLVMASRDLDMKGRGSLGVAGAAVDVEADLVLSEDLSASAGRDLYRYAREGNRIVVPATIGGTLASPSVSIDLGAALKRATRNLIEDEVKKGLGRLFKK